MRLSSELQKQENHGQAFPYFWEPASEKLVVDVNGEGEVVEIFCHEASETYSPKEYYENNDSLWQKFISEMYIELPAEFDEHEDNWVEYLDSEVSTVGVYYANWKQSTDHNPSLFLTDVQEHIKTNSHHLGRNPRTYARTVHRMPRMQSLIEIIYRINPQEEAEINHEARRFVFKKSE